MPHLYFLYRCRKLLLELKRKKEEYDKLMDKLQKDVRNIHVHFIRSAVGCTRSRFQHFSSKVYLPVRPWFWTPTVQIIVMLESLGGRASLATGLCEPFRTLNSPLLFSVVMSISASNTMNQNGQACPFPHVLIGFVSAVPRDFAALIL